MQEKPAVRESGTKHQYQGKNDTHTKDTTTFQEILVIESLKVLHQMVTVCPSNRKGAKQCLESPEVLIQLLAAKGFQVYAVVRKHTGEEWIKQKLQGLGASHVFLTSDDIRSIIEEMGQPLPQLALDGVGGTATNQLVQTLSKTADLVCFGVAGGSSQQAVTFATGKKWKGSLLQFSFDEWLNRDVSANAKILNDMLLDVTELVKQKRMQFVIKEYTTERFNMAVLNAKQIGRTHAVVLHLPRLEENPTRYTTEGDALALPERSLEKDYLSRHNRSWDLDFLQWEDVNADEEVEWRLEKERSLFRLHPQSQKDQKNVEGVLQLSQGVSSTPTAIAQELGCSPEKAEAVLFWLPGRGEIPQEHAHWLDRICVSNRELRVIILEPHQLEEDLKWQLVLHIRAVFSTMRFVHVCLCKFLNFCIRILEVTAVQPVGMRCDLHAFMQCAFRVIQERERRDNLTS